MYTIISCSGKEVIIKLTNEEHPVFKAHFPTKPILPGFLQIDIISNILNDEVVYIPYIKFIGHIYPNDIIVYSIKTSNKQKNITIKCDNKKVSEIRYESK